MFTKLWNFLDHAFLDFSRGGSLRGIRNNALIGCMSHNAVGESSLSYFETVSQPMCDNESYETLLRAILTRLSFSHLNCCDSYGPHITLKDKNLLKNHR